jgi:hypothetical protein
LLRRQLKGLTLQSPLLSPMRAAGSKFRSSSEKSLRMSDVKSRFFSALSNIIIIIIIISIMEELDKSSLHSLLEHFETNMCLGRQSNPGRLCCRRAITQRVTRRACILSAQNHYIFCGDFYPRIISRIFSPPQYHHFYVTSRGSLISIIIIHPGVGDPDPE